MKGELPPLTPGTLYLVATPIGNLGDITLRALETLRQVSVVLAEDTRRTRALLTHFEIKKPLVNHDAHASPAAIDALLERLLGGESAALVTDAGTPSVSDPGTALVAAAHERGVLVVPIPGVSAVTAAVAHPAALPFRPARARFAFTSLLAVARLHARWVPVRRRDNQDDSGGQGRCCATGEALAKRADSGGRRLRAQCTAAQGAKPARPDRAAI